MYILYFFVYDRSMNTDKWIAHPRKCSTYCGSWACNLKPFNNFKPPKPPIKYGAKCPKCFIKMPLTGKCDCEGE